MINTESLVPYWRLSAFYFFYFALLGAWLPFLPLYLKDLGFQAKEIGYLAGIMMVTKVLAPSIWGWLADRTGRRDSIIRWGSLLALLIFLLIFLDKHFVWLAMIIACFSFFWNAILAQFEVVTLSHLSDRYERYSQIRVWGSIGFIAAVTGLGFAFDHINLSWLPWVIAALLLGIWLSSLVVAEKPSAHCRVSSGLSFWHILKQPPVIIFFICCFLLQVSHGPYYTFFSVFLEDYGYSRSATGLLWSLGVVAEVLIFIVMHRLLLRFTVHKIMICSLLLSMLRWGLIAYFPENLTLLLMAQCLHAASFGTFHACAVEVVRRYFGGGMEGQGMAFYSGVSFGAGGAVGAVLSGRFWADSAQSTFVVAALLCGVAVVLMMSVQTGRSEVCKGPYRV